MVGLGALRRSRPRQRGRNRTWCVPLAVVRAVVETLRSPTGLEQGARPYLAKVDGGGGTNQGRRRFQSFSPFGHSIQNPSALLRICGGIAARAG